MQVILVKGHGRKGMLYWGEMSDAIGARLVQNGAAPDILAEGSALWTKPPGACPAVLGYGGMGKTKEGDGKTPLGCFAVKAAYGILPDPGTRLGYTRITPGLYWCEDENSPCYNLPEYCSMPMPASYGEHMADYVPEYHYLLDIGYNESCEAGRGSGIFLHCRGSRDYTHGCIAVEEGNMARILRWLCPGAYMVISREAQGGAGGGITEEQEEARCMIN